MVDTCSDCKLKKGKYLYSHLFDAHAYTKDMIEELKQSSKQSGKIQCEVCSSWHASKNALRVHKTSMHRDVSEKVHMQCGLCEEELQNHRQLAEHAAAEHATSPGQYEVKTFTFENKQQYEDWRKETEEKNVIRWAATSVEKRGNGPTTYYRCSRALPRPQYSASKSKKCTKYCTAFMQVTERDGAFRVVYCGDHLGHEKEPGLLKLDHESEELIVSLLREGFSANQIVKKVRSACRDSGEQRRLYYTTPRDVRNIAIRNKIQPGRRHEKDILSLEMRVSERAEEDGIQLYVPATDESGDGFSLVVITPVQKQWLLKYSSRAICIDDTFNLTCYSLRLATIVVVDEWDKGLPAAYLLSNRMTETESELLFKEVKKVMPTFDTTFFMSDDTNSFYNGFRRVFPDSKAKKLLCVYHILRAVERNCKAKLLDKSLANHTIETVRELCRTSDQDTFTSKYSELLTYLREQGEEDMVEYFGRIWSGRVQQWGAFARHYSCVNTSMLIERFHRTLKHEIFGSKANVRVDVLLDALIALCPQIDEDRKIKMARGLWEGRHRLQQHHKAHALAIKLYGSSPGRVLVSGEGRWKVCDTRGVHHVNQQQCICDEVHNNHCQKDNCNVCPYAYRCDCLSDAKSGVSCVHIHAAALYGPEGKIAAAEHSGSTNLQEVDENHSVAEVEGTSSGEEDQELHVAQEGREEERAQEAEVAEESWEGVTRDADSLQDMIQQMDLIMAAMRSHALRLKKVPDREVTDLMERTLAVCKEQERALNSMCEKKIQASRSSLQRRVELPSVGRVPNPTPIRLLRRSALRQKRN